MKMSMRMFVERNTPQPEDACGMHRGSIRFAVVQRKCGMLETAGEPWRA